MKNYKTNFNIRKTFLSLLLFCFYIKVNAQIIISEIPDYNNLSSWASHPLKKDNADSIPLELKVNDVNELKVDVFFIHPTTYTDINFKSYNADINDTLLNEKTDNSSILYQASVFNENCRIFAPRYRQAHISCFYTDDSISKPFFDTAYSDIKSAFEYYLKNYNHNRPVIIASHSQGSIHAKRLLKEFFENKPLYEKLVCAYIIGMPVPENYFTKIPPCKDSTQTGCFVSWRTFKKGYYPEFIKKENFKCVVVNPLSWKTDEQFISKKYNKGGLTKSFKKLNKNIVSAQVYKNVLWSCKPDIFGKIFFFKKNFHIGDINLFYVNIRDNVKQRIKYYFKSH